jgi:hypothetical protein
MRIAILAFVVGAAGAASANTSHHASGGGSSEAACIRWEPIPVDMAGVDMAVVDMAGADMAGRSLVLDGGAPADMRAADPHAGMQCVERASLFSCAYAPSGGRTWGGVALLAIVALTLARGRRRTGRRD